MADKENEMGLTNEEMAFYDALTKPQVVKDLYTNDQLIGITKELTEQLRKSRTIDWEKKESARAGMRRMIKRLLKKYDYPPEGDEEAMTTVIQQCEIQSCFTCFFFWEAMTTVIQQCEMWTDNI